MNLDYAGSRAVQTGPTDVFAGTIPVKLTKQELLELSSLSPFRGSLHIAAEWILIVASVYLCQRFWNPFLYLITVAFIGARQHALLILMHDGVHYRLFRNRRLNDWIAEIVLAWPNLISARAYRKNHFAHHSYLNTPQDPDWARRQGDASWVFPMHWGRLAMLIIRDASGVGAIFFLRLARTLLSKDTGVSTGFLCARYGFYVAVTALFVWFGAFTLLLLYWFVPLFTWLIVIFRIRSIAEHSAIDSSDRAYSQTRSTQASMLEHLFVAPKNVNYHIEHHFYPSVPFYRLPELHRTLMSKPEFKNGVHLTRSYLGVLRECLGDTHSRAVRHATEASFATEANSNLA
ncbi:MAG: fatty acid desaturase [Candidatus Binatus sp.]|uniref:fatty acid desaturase family protein n=1 Tax=Candidatus Binatus sp. TaxID=2811406 RepID=UPI00271CA039|nr:fatty acid desaturase [Candidatus Binatus sp.]MDO8434157.1 fatty acid desaturase [Candidatus Binatus sp.]